MPSQTSCNKLPEQSSSLYLLLVPPFWLCSMRPLTQLAAARPPTPAPAYAIRRGKDGLDADIDGFRGDPGIRATLEILLPARRFSPVFVSQKAIVKLGIISIDFIGRFITAYMFFFVTVPFG